MQDIVPQNPPENDSNSPQMKNEALLLQGQKTFKRSFLFFCIVALLIGSFFIGYQEGKDRGNQNEQEEQSLSPDEAILLNKENRDKTIDFSLFWKVWELLKEKYVDKSKLDARELFYGAIDGMLAATGDPYTTFFSPKEYKEFNEDISGTFEGIGAEMGIKNDILTVIAPLEGTPAEKSGLLAGDKVVKIDDISTAILSLEEAVSKIRGQKGTEVKLTIFREGDEETQDITVKRDVISVKSVRFEKKDGDIAYIRVSRFGEETESEFAGAVKETEAMKAKGVIIDLRNNPGGFLDTAVTMASLMLPEGKVVVVEEDSEGKHTEMKAEGGDVLSSVPTVIIINEGSASASEILAGALRDNRENVRLVGKKSFGKGSVQQLISVGKNTSVKITIARWLTPNLKQIHNVGISPDVEVSFKREDAEKKQDPQMDKALETLKTLMQ